MDNEIIENSQSSMGTIRITNEVVEVIAALATSQVEGIVSMSGGFVGDLANMLGRGKKGVKVEVGEHETAVDLSVVVEYGVSIPEVAAKVQASVKEAIESMTGLNVVEVNVQVQGIDFQNQQEPKEEEHRVK